MELDLAKYSTITSMVETYQHATMKISDAYTMLQDALKELQSVGLGGDVLPNDRYPSQPSESVNSVLSKLKIQAWETLFKKSQVKECMTPKRLKEFQDSLEKPDQVPDITEPNVINFIEGIRQAVPNMIDEFVKETFDWLKPGVWGCKRYKTNEKAKYELQEKLIITMAVDSYFKDVHITYHSENHFRAMDSAFHLLDGKGVSKYPGNALDCIREQCVNGNKECETEYFKFKFYKNGNCHITFKRLDLLQKINAIGGGMTLKAAA